MALGYGAVAAREIGKAIQKNDFSFRGYRSRVLRSALGQTLLVRWLIASFIYAYKWKWFQILMWRIMKPVVTLIGLTVVVNWGKRL